MSPTCALTASANPAMLVGALAGIRQLEVPGRSFSATIHGACSCATGASASPMSWAVGSLRTEPATRVAVAARTSERMPEPAERVVVRTTVAATSASRTNRETYRERRVRNAVRVIVNAMEPTSFRVVGPVVGPRGDAKEAGAGDNPRKYACFAWSLRTDGGEEAEWRRYAELAPSRSISSRVCAAETASSRCSKSPSASRRVAIASSGRPPRRRTSARSIRTHVRSVE